MVFGYGCFRWASSDPNAVADERARQCWTNNNDIENMIDILMNFNLLFYFPLINSIEMRFTRTLDCFVCSTRNAHIVLLNIKLNNSGNVMSFISNYCFQSHRHCAAVFQPFGHFVCFAIVFVGCWSSIKRINFRTRSVLLLTLCRRCEYIFFCCLSIQYNNVPKNHSRNCTHVEEFTTLARLFIENFPLPFETN